MWRIEFYNAKGHRCYADIAKEGETTTTIYSLTPSANPFEIEIDDNDDIFTPVRTSSGNIGIIINRILNDGTIADTSATIRDILNALPRERPVTFRCTSAGMIWKGFVKSESFEHKLFGVSEELNIPIISTLKALEGINVSITVGSNNYWKTFGQILIDMTDLIGEPYKYFVIPKSMMDVSPSYNNPFEAKINLLNYVAIRSADSFETDEEGNTIFYDGKPYIEVLSDFCKFMGLTAVENGETLIFQRADLKTVQYNFYTRQQVLDGGRTADKTETLDDKSIGDFFTFANTDNTFSTISGKSSVEVTGKKGEFDDPFTLSSVRDMSTTIGDGSTFEDVKGNTVAEVRLRDNPLVECSNNGSPTETRGVLEVCRWDSNLKGSFIELLGEISDIKKSGAYIYSYSGSVSPCMLLVGNPASLIIKPLVACSLSAPAVVLKMRLKVKNNPTAEWSKPSPLPNEATSILVHINGNLQSIIETEDEITCVLFNYNGEAITISKHPQRTERFLNIEQLELTYNTKGVDNFGANEAFNQDVVEKRAISNGFTEEYKIEIGLKSKGYGVNWFWCYVSSEKDIANRAAKFFKQPKSQITISVSAEAFIDPRRSFIYNNVPYNIIGQKMNAYDSTIKLTLQETLRS